jgi:competence protein ComEC
MILTAMFIQLIIEPAAIKDVGFQLSYAAVAGIAWIYPHLRSFWPGNPSDDKGMVKGLRWIWNSAALSIACQVTTGPLAYIYFHSFPMQFILTNLIAIPLTGLIIPSALLTLVASSFGCCPDILLRITEMLVTALSESLYIISTQW